jgi:hypothetical protein
VPRWGGRGRSSQLRPRSRRMSSAMVSALTLV